MTPGKKPMVLMVNGAFGIGKTSVARQLAAALPDSIVVDPEPIGITLQALRRAVGRPVDDFQDLRLWRRLTIAAIRVARRLRRNVIVPMAFSNRGYLDEVRAGVGRDGELHHFCLVASLPMVQARLRARGSHPASHAWEFRRAAECCHAHRDRGFAEHVDTESRPIDAIAAEILQRIDRKRAWAATATLPAS